MDVVDLTSLAGIIALTTILTEVCKKQFYHVKYLEKIPVFVLPVTIALVLTWLAHDIFHTLQGDLNLLLAQAFLAALASSGLYEWPRNGKHTIKKVEDAKADTVDIDPND